MATLLDCLNPGQIAYAIGLAENTEPFLKKKLLSLGFCHHHELKVIRKAPLGCPLEVQILDTRIMLRKSEAHCVLVKDSQ